MKQKLFYLLLLILSSFSGYCQTQWESLNPKPSYNNAKKVKFVNEQIGFIINGNDLLQTKNAGGTWYVKQSMPGANDIKFIDETGYIACNDGYIYKSIDSGETWLAVTRPTGKDLNFHTLSIIDNNTVAIASSNTLLFTIDGGTTWTNIILPPAVTASANLTTMCFTDALTGHIATNNGSIYKTIDGGSTWTIKIETNIFPSDYVTIYFVNKDLGFATQKHSELLRTIDGGETWIVVEDSDLSELIYDIHFTTNTTGYACSEFGFIYKTIDAGLSWTRISTQDALYEYSNLYGVFAVKNSVYTVGMGGCIYKYFDGGGNVVSYSPTYRDIKKITFYDATTAYAINLSGQVYKSSDNGDTWQFQNSISGVRELQFLTPTIGYASQSSGIQKTTDGGKTWTYISILNESIYSMVFLDANTGFVSGGYNNPSTKKTTNGGATWQTVSNSAFIKMQFLNAKVGYALSRGGYSIVYKTVDGGNTWNEIYKLTDGDINDFSFTDDNSGYFAGYPGVQRKTSDGGTTWEEISFPDYFFTSIIRFGDNNNGYIVTDYGQIYKTIDGGKNWRFDSVLTTHDIIYHGKYLYLGGSNGKILRRLSGVVLNTPDYSKNNDDDVYLYPNPATGNIVTIHSSLNTTSYTITDISGRQIYSGIPLNPTRFIVDISNKPSGIYFINLNLSDNNSITKKIIIK